MLILGCLIAVAVIVFLSNSAPSRAADTGGGVVVTAGPSAGGTGGDTGEGMVSTSGSTGGGGSSAAAATTGLGAPGAQTYAPASSSNKDTLKSGGETLAEGASLTSKNGKYVFTYEYGNAVVKSGNFTMWSSAGRLASGGVFKITDDGNIGIFPSQYSVTPSGWASATAGQGTGPYTLIMRDSGQLVLLDSAPTVIWTAPVTMPPVGVDCVMGDFGDWSACTKNCGGGTQRRTRPVITQPNAGGKECDALEETRPCNTDPCPDCAFTWSPFGQCLNSDPVTGAGKKQAQLLVSSPSGPGGSVCPDPNSNIQDCVNCVFSPWNPTGELSAQACNQTTGKKSQSRTITVPASGGGVCTEPTQREEPCAVDCQLNPWPDTWSTCDNKVNGVGKNTRTTTVKFQPKNGGKACTVASGVLSGSQTCDAAGNCREERSCGDCVQGTTYTYGTCDAATGKKSRTRVGDVQATFGGVACPTVTDEVNCDVDCAVSAWTEWSSCAGAELTKTHTRTVTQAKKNGGAECPALTETEACPAINCEVSDWGAWGACSARTGKKERTRTVTKEAKAGGTACPALTETQDCPVDAVCGWSAWSACSKPCNGTQTQSLTTITPAKNGGQGCLDSTDTRACNADAASCSATAYQEKNFTGLNAKFNGRVGSVSTIGMVNDRVRAIDVPDGVGVVVHENGISLGAGNNGYLNPGRWVSDSWWENRISAMRAYKIPDPPANAGQYGAVEHKQPANTNDPAIISAYYGLTEAECANRCDYTNRCVTYISEQTGNKNCYILNNPINTVNNTNFNMKYHTNVGGLGTQGVNKCHIFDQRAKAGWAPGSGWQFDRNQWKGKSAYDAADADPEGICSYS